ncbi:MAG: tRNA lysidine(34) synthetase TilS [Tannerellaceae bacterium]|nr:tRNA lysidine(34) synthetase TilS [Tannerellaceae bacterium]
MIEQVRKYIQVYNLLETGKPVIVGLSGGADSVALLAILTQLGYDCRAAHCNFHLRGDESDRDEEFSHLLARSLSVPFYHIDFDTERYAAENHLSIEMAARELRYRWFEEMRATEQAQAIAVAHHRDDQVETILLNLVRGTGIRGMRGMTPKNGTIVRPLLSVSKKQLLDWLEEQHLNYVTDSTNNTIDYKRNYIRHEIVPALEKLNPSFQDTVVRNAHYLRDVETIYDHSIRQAGEDIMDQALRISIQKLCNYPAPENMLYELLKPYGFNRFVIADIFRALPGESGKQFDSPEYTLVKDREYLLLSVKGKSTDSSFYIEENTEQIEYPVKLSFRKIVLGEEFAIDRDKHIAYFDYEKLSFPLTIRTWQSGDWFIPFGMKGRKKLSDYFSDLKYSRPEKEKQWLLCSGEDIIWVTGHRTDDRYKVDQHTRYVLIVKIFR